MTYLSLTCVIALVAGYIAFVRHPLLRIEGRRPVPIAAFGRGAAITHAFLMDDDILDAVDVRIAADEPSALRVAWRLLRLYATEPGAEDNPAAYKEVRQWTETTLNVGSGERWQRFQFMPIAESRNQWYAFEIRLLEATPAGHRAQAENARPHVSLIASQDNPRRGGKLWVGGVRQTGSLFVRAEGATVYEQFLVHVEPRLPPALRNRAIQMIAVLVCLWALVALMYAMLFGPDDRAGDPADPGVDFWTAHARPGTRAWRLGAAQLAALSLALALFFLVPDNPAHSLPLFPELVFLGTLCLMAGIAYRNPAGEEDSRSRLRWDEKLFWTLIAVCFVYTAFRAVQSGRGVDLGFDPCAAIAPSPIVRLECRLQASFAQNYAWRNLVRLTLMLAIGVAAAVVTRRRTDFFRSALAAVALVGLAHASIGWAATWLQIDQVVPTWIMVNSYAFDRFTFFIPYPGYVWQQMAPALAIAVWQAVYAPTRIKRIAALVASFVIASAIGATRTRGGLLVVCAMAGLGCLAVIVRTARRSRGTQSVFAVARLSMATLVCISLLYPVVVSWSFWGAYFSDIYRLMIWDAALSGVKREHPFLGFGYARWQEFSRVSVGTDAAGILDSAHSVWIRVLFELGGIGLVLSGLCVVAAVLVAMRNAARLNGGRFLVLCAAAGLLVCATFEEVDWARPVVVTYAFMAGICCGLPFRRSANASQTAAVPSAPFQLRGLPAAGKVVASLGILSIGVALATRAYFTSGAYELEGVGVRGEPSARWLRQRASIPVYGPQPLWVFKASVLTGTGRVRLTPPASDAFTLDVTKDDQPYLPMLTRGSWWPSRHAIQFEKGYDAWVRQVAGQIVYPPIVIPIPLVMTRGASDPEPARGGASVLCFEDCVLAVLHINRRPTTVRLELESLSSPKETPVQSVQVASFANMSYNRRVSLTSTTDLVLLEKGVYTSIGKKFEPIPLEIPAASGWYKLRIAAIDAPADARKPAMKVVITESPLAVSN